MPSPLDLLYLLGCVFKLQPKNVNVPLFKKIFLSHVVHLSSGTVIADVMAARNVLAVVFPVMPVTPRPIGFPFVVNGGCCKTAGQDEGFIP